MAYLRRLQSGLWQATIRDPQGRRHTRTDPLKAVAKAWAEESEARMRRGEWTNPQDGRKTVGQWWEQWSANRNVELATARRNESHWRVHVKPRWGDVPLAQVTAWDVEGWATSLAKAGVGATTRNKVLQLLRTLMGEATRHRLIAADPTATVKIPAEAKHVDRFLTRAEWDRLDAATDRDVLVRCLLLAGLRWAEAAGLHGHRVDLERRQLLVVETVRRDRSIKPQPKSAAGWRIVPLTDALVEGLTPLVRARPGGLLFPATDGRALDYSNWRRDVWLPAVARADLADPQPTPHDLRHTFGSWLAEANVPPHEIAALMGHSSLRATERYLHAGDGRWTRALDALTPDAAQCVAPRLALT